MGRIGAAGLRAVLLWSSEKLNVQLRQAPFAHHRGQVGEVGYGPQRMFIIYYQLYIRARVYC